MTKFFFTSFLLLFTFFSLNVKAQNLEEVSELMPYSEWLEQKRIEQEQINEQNKRIIGADSISVKIKYRKIKNFIVDVKTEVSQINENIVTVKFTTPIKELIFEDVAGKPTSRFRYYGRIISKDKKFDKVFDDSTTLIYKVEELFNGIENSTTFKKTFKLPQGKYKLIFMLKDKYSGISKIKTFKLEIK
jgi:hypothetical protein